MRDFLQLIRVKQWIKNGFIFFPAFFADQLLHPELFFKLVLGFLAFSLVASSVYIMNDWFDAPADRQHPKKKSRPIASGAVSSKLAFRYILLLLIPGLALSSIVDVRFGMLLLVYFGINLFYSAGIKNFPVLDVMVVSFGFILRILSGGEIADVPISFYMLVVTFGLSMFLAFAKRRSDYLLFEETGKQARKVIQYYSRNIINVCLILTALITSVFYILYTLSHSTIHRIGSEYLFITSVFVISGLIRYLYITFVRNQSGNPTEVLYKDVILQVIILAWIGSFAWFIYG